MSTSYTPISGPVILNARLKAKPGQGDELERLLLAIKAVADTDAEPGTLTYRTCRFGDDFAIWEEYASHEAVEIHLANKLVQELLTSSALAEKDAAIVEFYKEFGKV